MTVRHHRGVANCDPGKRTIGEAYRKDADPTDPELVWDKRRVISILPNGWQLEMIETQTDADRVSARGGGCVGNIFRTHYAFMRVLRACTRDGTMKGIVTLGDKQHYDTGKKRGDYVPYSSSNGLGLQPRPVIKLKDDSREWYVLETIEVTKSPYYNRLDWSTAQPAIIQQYMHFYTTHKVEEKHG